MKFLSILALTVSSIAICKPIHCTGDKGWTVAIASDHKTAEVKVNGNPVNDGLLTCSEHGLGSLYCHGKRFETYRVTLKKVVSGFDARILGPEVIVNELLSCVETIESDE